MAVQDVLRKLVDHWDDVQQLLDPAARAQLAELISQLTAGSDDQALDAADDMVALLLGSLPPEHPVVQAARGDFRLAGAPDPAISVTLRWGLAALSSEAQEIPENVAVEQTWDHATRRLLGAASLSTAQILARGQSPDQPSLIRLERADGTPQWPAFQFGPDGAVLPVVSRINAVLDAAHDPWGVADWWLGQNAWLDDAPARLIGILDDADLIATAGLLAGD